MKKPVFKNLTLDGGFGGLILERCSAPAGAKPELLNLENADKVLDLHREYVEAGADVIYTNTFGANAYRFRNDLDEIIRLAIALAKKARPKYVALDIGPLGKIVGSAGVAFETAVNQFKKIIRAAGDKTDYIVVETMTNLAELRAALIAAKESSRLPVAASMSFDKGGRTVYGVSAESFAVTAQSLGAFAIGANCSLGPGEMYAVAKRLSECAYVPVFIKPNAGLPSLKDGKTVYDVSPEEFNAEMEKIASLGINVLGGCCGTTPEFIKNLSQTVKNAPEKEKSPYVCRVCSATSALDFTEFRVIGERINPTGKKRLKQALIEQDYGYVLNLGLEQSKEGADILDVNCGLGEIDETAAMLKCIDRLQSVAGIPLQIDSSNPKTLEQALRCYNGRAIVNSVNGEAKSLAAIIPVAAKYGAVLIGLALDEKGIPKTPAGRTEIAKRIITAAKTAGIRKEDILIDALTLSEASERGNARTTLESVKALSAAGIKTVLGVSNVSFGMPGREDINAAFLEEAKKRGLSAAIINPKTLGFEGSKEAFSFINGEDGAVEEYLEFASYAPPIKKESDKRDTLRDAVISGRREDAVAFASELVKSCSEPLEIAKSEIIPALDEVGRRYEEGVYFLPQLIASADAAKDALNILQQGAPQTGEDAKRFLVATVKGDIHDIGKNIVKAVVSNFGYRVIDLGRDVDYSKLRGEVAKNYPCALGLSALMTTTAQNMAKSIEAVRSEFPDIPVFVGGAVLTEEFAEKIGGIYCKDAMDTVKKLKLYENKF